MIVTIPATAAMKAAIHWITGSVWAQSETIVPPIDVPAPMVSPLTCPITTAPGLEPSIPRTCEAALHGCLDCTETVSMHGFARVIEWP